MKKLLFLLALMTSAANAQVYNVFTPGGDLSGTWNSQAVVPGAITLAKQANLAANSVPCNATSSAATMVACNPLVVANLMNAKLSAVSAVSLSSGTPAFGAYTNDGIVLVPNEIVLVYGAAGGQTCGTGTVAGGTGGAISGNVCEGLWVVKAGAAWTRPANFPSGYVIPQFCVLAVEVESGLTKQGHSFFFGALNSGNVTIDTSSPSILDSTVGLATATTAGLVAKVTAVGSLPAAVVATTPTGGGGAIGDCVMFNDVAGSLADGGNFNIGTPGPCIVGDATGHILASPNSQGAPVITGTGCSASGTASDNSGAIVAAGADACTVTFSTAYGSAPFCAVAGYSATVLPFISTPPTTAAVHFSTAAAGTFSYVCM